MNQTKIALAVHGGAGTILKSEMTAEIEAEYRGGLKIALTAGWNILQKGGSALDAAEAAVVELENFPLFNAGRGAVFTHAGKNEMDACLMEGESHRAGAVASVRNIKNPVKLARLVLEKSEHILLAGEGANEFAAEMKIETAADNYFFTDIRYRQLLEARAAGVVRLDHTIEKRNLPDKSGFNGVGSQDSSVENSKVKMSKPIGTVGAVACDLNGSVAAATSTGGMTNKRYGRIGDTPLPGAGTYADNKTCAVSCTGHGEFFMRSVAAYDVAALMKYKNLSLNEAANEVIEKLRSVGGEGGLIAVDAKGNVALPFNSSGMYRGFITSGGEMNIKIYED